MAETVLPGVGCGGLFPSTHWSVVLTAVQTGSPAADRALAKLCEAYWYPLYGYIRRRGYTPQEAEDLTQEFFDRLVHGPMLAGLTCEGGKFRSFLLTVLKRFLANEWDRQHAQKRGGHRAVVSINDSAELHYQSALVENTTPELLYERQWLLTILERVLDQLRAEYSRAGKAPLFAALEGCLPGAQTELSYGAAAAALGLSEGAARMAVLRLRRRYGELLRSEIAGTVSGPEEVDEEIRHLMAVMREV